MKIKNVLIILLFIFVLTGCGKKEEVLIDNNEEIYLEGDISNNIDESIGNKVKEEENKEEITKPIEEEQKVVEDNLPIIEEYSFETDESLFANMDKLMSVDYDFFDKDIELKPNSDLESEDFEQSIFGVDSYLFEFNRISSSLRDLYNQFGELNDRSLEDLSSDAIDYNFNKIYYNLEDYEYLALNNPENLNFDNFTTFENSKELYALKDYLYDIDKDIEVLEYHTVEYRRLSSAYKTYIRLIKISTMLLYELNEYNYRGDDCIYDYLKNEAGQEYYKLRIKSILEEAFNLKKEIDKVDSHLTNITDNITTEVLEAEKENK